MYSTSPNTPESTRGVFFVHSAPSAMCPHVEWAVAGVLGHSVDFSWSGQPAEPGSYRCEVSWQGAIGSAAAIASALRGWQRLRFEVTEDSTQASEGARYSYTPELGIFHAMTGLHGDIVIPEDRIKACLVRARSGGTSYEEGLEELLGVAWDDALEPFRHAGDGAPVRWLHQVV